MSRIIKLDSKNFNRHTAEGMELLEKSISEVGAIEGITIDADGESITGNARKETFDKLGYKPKFIELGEKEYPVIQTDLTGEKRVKAAIYANTVAQKNIDLDMDLIQEVAIDEYELEFDDLGLDIETMELEAHDDDFDEAPPENPKTVLGDLYEIGEHRLLCGDSTKSEDVERLMNGEKADMVFTDPDFSKSATPEAQPIGSAVGG